MGLSPSQNHFNHILVVRYSISFRSFWYLINLVVWTLLFASLGIIGSLFEWRGKFLSWVARTWSKVLLSIAGIKYNTIGLERLDIDNDYFFAANHESALDIPLVFAGLPFHLVAISKIELKWIPIFGWAMVAGGHFFVDRRNHARALKSLEKAKLSMAKNPRSVIIYPEGTRSLDWKVKPFKKGGLVMAMQMGVPVVPIALCGTGNVLKKKGLTLNRQTIELRIGNPIETQNLGSGNRNQFVEDVRQEVIALKAKWENAT